MRQLKLMAYVTLDGVMQAPGGPEEDTSGGFEYGGWTFGYWDALMGEVADRAFAVPFELLLGRRTYEIFAAHWPYQDDAMAATLNAVKKYVVSTTLSELEWQPAQRIAGEVADTISALKKTPGPDLCVIGSSRLIQTLLAHALIDEFQLWTFPLVIGKGKRLFGEGTVPGDLTLVDSQTSSTGVIMSTYRPAGAIKLGSFMPDKPSDKELARRRRMAQEG